jgi:hypothetical protein
MKLASNKLAFRDPTCSIGSPAEYHESRGWVDYEKELYE